jgi:hypothetical protein
MKSILFWGLLALVTQGFDAQIITEKKSIEKQPAQAPAQVPLKTRPEISFLDLEERLPSADRYILDIKSLMNYFVDHKIPADFPVYRNDKSFAFNQRKALRWFRKHQNLIAEERKTWLNLK